MLILFTQKKLSLNRKKKIFHKIFIHTKILECKPSIILPLNFIYYAINSCESSIWKILFFFFAFRFLFGEWLLRLQRGFMFSPMLPHVIYGVILRILDSKASSGEFYIVARGRGDCHGTNAKGKLSSLKDKFLEVILGLEINFKFWLKKIKSITFSEYFKNLKYFETKNFFIIFFFQFWKIFWTFIFFHFKNNF